MTNVVSIGKPSLLAHPRDVTGTHVNQCNATHAQSCFVRHVRRMQIFHHPFTAILSAPSCSGKSTLAYNIIKHSDSLVSVPFDVVLVLFRTWQPLYDQMRRELPIPVHFFEHAFPGPLKDLVAGFQAPVILIDDGLCPANRRDVEDLFTRESHHLGTSVILLTQSLFDAKQPTLRLCHRNTKILIVFGCPRDQGSLRTLVFQMHPDKRKANLLLSTMEDILKEPYRYIMMDFQPTCPAIQRYKTDILSEHPTVFTFPAETKPPLDLHGNPQSFMRCH